MHTNRYEHVHTGINKDIHGICLHTYTYMYERYVKVQMCTNLYEYVLMCINVNVCVHTVHKVRHWTFVV